MRPIISNNISIDQYLNLLREDPHQFRPACCPHCHTLGRLNYHGIYYRKPDRENPSHSSLNPIPITRFYCTVCKRTCSVLPECIPPRRWYLWSSQEKVISKVIAGSSFCQVAKQTQPSRSTITRWWYRLLERYPDHRAHLCSRFSWLGYSDDVAKFWRLLLKRQKLSAAMFVLNHVGVTVP